MRRQFHLGTIAGIPIQVDPSWFMILALVTWTLATSYFPAAVIGLPLHVYWAMGLLAALLLFTCVLLHELGHSLVAKAYGIPVRRVTLFIFGGVAQILNEPKRPWIEFIVALAGPLVSIALAAVCFGITQVWRVHSDWQLVGWSILKYLWIVNVGIIIFNLLPGFPLDGGRVARAILWAWTKDFTKATRIACALGNVLGIGLFILGGISVLEGRWLNGIWSVVLGAYLRNAAQTSYQDVVLRQTLLGVPVQQLMSPEVSAVPLHLTLQELIDTYALRQGAESFPVVDEGHLLGVVTVASVKRVDRAQWPTKTVSDVMQRDVARFSARPSTDVLEALARMHAAGVGQLVVVDDGRVLGTVSQAAIGNLLRLKMELGRAPIARGIPRQP